VNPVPVQRRTSNLRKPVVISAIFHLAIFITFGVMPTFRLPLRESPLSVTWVELPRGTSEEVGIGVKQSQALPKSTIEEQKQPPPPEPPKQQPLVATKPPEVQKAPEAAKTEITRPKMEVEQKGAKVRPATPPPPRGDRKIQNALAKIDAQLKQRAVDPEAAQVEQSGEGYKYGTSNKPLRVPPSDPEYLKYQATVRSRIMREWILPIGITEGGGAPLNARLAVRINDDGEVTAASWESRSGNTSFDQSALRSVKKASPFPRPPDRLAWEAYNEGFLIEFDQRSKIQY
jgi:periplasmic protein TonB